MAGFNRRQTLIGLGALAGGAGVIVGSGAFTAVEAERDVEIQTAGDADALLELRPDGSGTIVQQEEDGLLFFEVENGGTGINRRARTSFRPAFSVTNNGSNQVGFYIEEDGSDINHTGILDFQDHVDGNSIVGTEPSDGISIDPNADETVSIDLVINLIDHDWDDLEDIETVTLVAEVDD